MRLPCCWKKEIYKIHQLPRIPETLDHSLTGQAISLGILDLTYSTAFTFDFHIPGFVWSPYSRCFSRPLFSTLWALSLRPRLFFRKGRMSPGSDLIRQSLSARISTLGIHVRRHTHTARSPSTILSRLGNKDFPPLKNNAANHDSATATAITTVTNKGWILQGLAHEQGQSNSMWAGSDICWMFILREVPVSTTKRFLPCTPFYKVIRHIDLYGDYKYLWLPWKGSERLQSHDGWQ